MANVNKFIKKLTQNVLQPYIVLCVVTEIFNILDNVIQSQSGYIRRT